MFSAPNRVDPYWDGVWEIGSQASWERAELLRRKLDAGMDRNYLAPRFAGRDEALEYLTSSFSTDWLRMLGAVLMWRTMTSQQLAAITGADQNSGLSAPTIRAAFEAGLIDLGSWSSALRRASLKSDATWLVRPSRDSRQAFRHLSRHMTWPEWVSVTAGQDWSVGMQHSRHNALTVELALRLAEYADVGTVLGERLGTIDLLAGSGIGRDIYDADGRSADAVIVRPDGLRIAIETTASTSRILEAKMRRWAQTLAATPFQDSGLVLWLFIDPTSAAACWHTTGSSCAPGCAPSPTSTPAASETGSPSGCCSPTGATGSRPPTPQATASSPWVANVPPARPATHGRASTCSATTSSSSTRGARRR